MPIVFGPDDKTCLAQPHQRFANGKPLLQDLGLMALALRRLVALRSAARRMCPEPGTLGKEQGRPVSGTRTPWRPPASPKAPRAPEGQEQGSENLFNLGKQKHSIAQGAWNIVPRSQRHKRSHNLERTIHVS